MNQFGSFWESMSCNVINISEDDKLRSSISMSVVASELKVSLFSLSVYDIWIGYKGCW